MKEKTMNKSKTNWDKVKDTKDNEIDYSDNPELTTNELKNMHFMSKDEFLQSIQLSHATKVDVHIKLDKEIVDFFKAQGKKYQTKINNLLRAYVDYQKLAH